MSISYLEARPERNVNSEYTSTVSISVLRAADPVGEHAAEDAAERRGRTA